MADPFDSLRKAWRTNIRIPGKDGLPRRRPARTKRAKPRGDYLSPRIRDVIDLIVWQGMKRGEACQQIGISENWFKVALQMPKVLSHYNTALDSLRTGLKARALHNIAGLAETAESEAVRLNANRHLDPAPQQAPAVQVNVGLAMSPGYMIALQQPTERVQAVLQAAGSTRQIGDPARQHEPGPVLIDHRPPDGR